MGTMWRIFFAGALLLGAHGIGNAQAVDVGLVQQLAGEVTYVSPTGSGKVRAFMKMRQGDRFTLPDAAQVQIVYFQNGRRETWRGPASFSVGAERSDALRGAVQEVASLPVGVSQKIQKIPDMIQMARLGGIQVRSAPKERRSATVDKAELAAARATYAQLREQLPPEDITAELYLFSVLQDYLLYGEMKALADEMVRKQPASAEAQQLAAWVKARMQPAK